jgi:hypothetical protein
MKFFTGILLLILMPVFFESCWIVDDGPQQTYFSIIDLKAIIAKRGAITAEQTSSPVNTDDFMIMIQIDPHYAYHRTQTMGIYADAPPKSQELVTAFSITSDSTLTTLDGRSFPPSGDLTSLFDDPYGFWFHSFDQHLFGTDYVFYPNFHLDKKRKLNFRVQITLDDGRKFDLNTGIYEIDF